MKPHEKLGVAIADAGYFWTPEMRSAWEELDKEMDKKENNANELADLVAEDTSSDLAQETAYTLRKQQAEIEKLKAEVVMYRTDAEKLTMRLIDIAVSVPVKELTDEEIECTRSQCGIELVDGTWRIDEQKFARAILRKAQEQ